MSTIAVRLVSISLVLMIASAPAAGGLPDPCTPGPFVIFFDHGSAKLDADSRSTLDNVLAQRGDCGSSHAYISGYTDTREPRELSRKRAEATRIYLARHGVPASDVTIAWLGSDKLRVPTPPDTAERQNRRVEFVYGPAPQDSSRSK